MKIDKYKFLALPLAEDCSRYWDGSGYCIKGALVRACFPLEQDEDYKTLMFGWDFIWPYLKANYPDDLEKIELAEVRLIHLGLNITRKNEIRNELVSNLSEDLWV